MKKYLSWSLYLPFLALLAWVFVLTVFRLNARDVRVRIEGFDPRDLLSGHYIQYTIDWKNTDCGQFENGVCPKEDFCNPQIKGRARVCRFYIPQKYARTLDSLLQGRDKTKADFEVVYAYQKARAMPKELLINGKPWKEFVK